MSLVRLVGGARAALHPLDPDHASLAEELRACEMALAALTEGVPPSGELAERLRNVAIAASALACRDRMSPREAVLPMSRVTPAC